jgi:cyanophycinase-like exopeptidase
MQRIVILLFSLLSAIELTAQTYYFSGDTSDVQTVTTGGIVLSGGAGEVDAAMRWFLQRTGGGDVVVLRASGSDGYQSYLFSELGVPVNSVQTILMTTYAQAQNTVVAEQIRRAEGIWIAGGDQAKYVNFWKNTPVEDALRYAIHVKKVPIGGISAGMAIQGAAYFSAANGTVLSGEALANPYDERVAVGYGDFLDHPHLVDVITDTHFDDPDRKGRTTTFLARLYEAHGIRGRAIACDELTAVCIDTMGIAQVFGQYASGDQGYAYFVQVNCEDPIGPELLASGTPLTWKRNNAALKSCRIPGTLTGDNKFDLNDWRTAIGTYNWQNWWVNSGGLFNLSNTATPPECSSLTKQLPVLDVKVTPNPTTGNLNITVPADAIPVAVELFDASGRSLKTDSLKDAESYMRIPEGQKGTYWMTFKSRAGVTAKKVVVE